MRTVVFPGGACRTVRTVRTVVFPEGSMQDSEDSEDSERRSQSLAVGANRVSLDTRPDALVILVCHSNASVRSLNIGDVLHRSVSLASAKKLEVHTDCVNLGELNSQALPDVRPDPRKCFQNLRHTRGRSKDTPQARRDTCAVSEAPPPSVAPRRTSHRGDN